MQITEVFEYHNTTVTRQSSSQRKSRRLSGQLHCLNFVFPAENETLAPVCVGCKASSSSDSLSMLKIPNDSWQLFVGLKCMEEKTFVLNQMRRKHLNRKNTSNITIINKPNVSNAVLSTKNMCRHEKQRHRTGKSRSHTSNNEQERFAERVCWFKSHTFTSASVDSNPR